MGVILLAGVYGVGKSTIAEQLSAQTGLASFSAGDLISQKNGEQYGTNKLVNDKDKNQDILSACIAEILCKENRVILAGHFCIVSKEGTIDLLPESVFSQIDLEQIILLETSAETIISHMKNRDGKDYSLDLISRMLKVEKECATRTAMRLGCPLYIHTMEYTDKDIISLVAKL